MIFEAVRHILTPARREVRALGYVREAIAIEARYSRCHTAWATHLEKCQHHIMTAAEGLAANSTIMIIGSGALHDVPMAALSAYNLILVDIVHLPEIRRRYQKHGKVNIIEQDVTGLVKNLYCRGVVEKTAPDLPKVDLVISLNILSQLPLGPEKYARKHHIPLPKDFARSVMTDHVRLLRSLAPKILIISDHKRRYEKDGKPVESETVLTDPGLPDPFETWDWHIAPKGELDREISLTHQVGCWHMPPITLNSRVPSP